MARPTAIAPIARTEKFINMLVHGEPGVGKSVLAGSSPKALILAHNGDEMSSPAEHGSNADVWHVPDFHEMAEAYEYLRHDGIKEYEWVWWDNATLWQEQSLDKVMEELVAEKPHRNRWVPDMHEYLVVQNQLSSYVRNLQALPMHFGMTAHTMRSEDEDGKVQYVPMFQGGQGQLSQKICGYMGVVAYMYVVRKEGSEVRRINVSKRSKFLAKSRFKGLQGEMTDPTITKVLAAVQSSLTAAPRKAPAKSDRTTTRKRATT